MFYPYNSGLQNASKSFDMGNFSLWFNKLIPLNNEYKCKPCDLSGNDKEAVQYYKAKYDAIKTNIYLKNMLEQKHAYQKRFCDNYEKAGYETLLFRAKLNSPLITGVGQSHPNEVGMVFDHTIGISYIPSSSIKGIVRFAHTLGLIGSHNSSEFIDKNGEYIDEANEKTMIPDLFGGDLEKEKNGKKEIEKVKGKVIFLDVYPEKVPDLHVDIMNPHYGAYYSDEKGIIPPADYLEPTPIKFLTVKPGTIFIFRALLQKNTSLKAHLINAYEKALTVEGVGAKTAVGYGRFSIKIDTSSPKSNGKDKSLKLGKITEDKEIWEKVMLTWSPGNQLITASCQGKKATIKGKGIVPEAYHNKLFGRKKRSEVNKIEVEKIGNSYRIIKIFKE